MKQVPSVKCRQKEKYNQKCAHNFLFQEFGNIPINWFNTKLVTIGIRAHKKYTNSVLRFLTKMLYFILLFDKNIINFFLKWNHKKPTRKLTKQAEKQRGTELLYGNIYCSFLNVGLNVKIPCLLCYSVILM